MSTHHSIAPRTPRFRIRAGTVATGLGVLVAIAVTIVFLSLGGTHHSTVAIPPTAASTAGASMPQVHYLGPRQMQAARTPNRHAVAPNSSVGVPAQRYTCLGAAGRCVR
jgi:hypothetical protein